MPEFPEKFKQSIPEKIQKVVMRMLEKDPEQRYPDMLTFLEDIDTFEGECEDRTVPVTKKNGGRNNGVADAKDFLSRVEVHKTRWPLFAAAGVLAVLAITFGTSFMLSDKAGSHFGSMTAFISGEKESSAAIATPEIAPGKITEPSLDKNPKEPAGTPGPIGVGGRTQPTTAPFVEHPSLTQAPSKIPAVFQPESAWTELTIDTEPDGADVFFDSEQIGTTPLTLTEVPLGKHMIAMKLDGYPDFSGEISADTSEPAKIFYDFVAAKEALIPKGSLSIDSDPSGASVYIDGKKKGETPLDISELKAAEYTVKLELDEYETLQKKVAVKADENLRVALNLVEKPKFGDFVITSKPNGAEVLLNGQFKGATPLTLRMLPVGKYDVAVKKDGYELVQKELACSKNSATKYNATLSMTPQFAALQQAVAGDKCLELRDFTGAIAAYEKAISLDPKESVYGQKLNTARKTLMIRDVQEVLQSYESAYDSENSALLASLLNGGDPEFLSNQVSNADKLFQEFEHIDMSFSNITINGNNMDEAFVNLHIKIGASFAETGASVNLLEADQMVTLRKNPEAKWNICAIE